MITRLTDREAPLSNTGYDLHQNGFSVGVDWLDVTFKNINNLTTARQQLADIEAITSDPVGFRPTAETFNGHSWDGQGQGIYGTRVWYLASKVDEFGKFHCGQLKIALSGKVLARCDIEVLALYLKRTAIALDTSCQRIDIALDDYESFINLEDVLSAHEEGNFFNASYSEAMGSGMRGKTRGRTIYFGSPKSDKRSRWYNKFIESKGKQKGNRAETQYRRKPANLVFHQWIDRQSSEPESVPRMLQNLVLGAIDFRLRNEDSKSRERCSLLEWYSALCELLSATPARIAIKAEEQTVQKSIDWLKKSVAQSLASIKIALQGDFPGYLDRLIFQGAEVLNNQKRYIAQTTDRSRLCYDI